MSKFRNAEAVGPGPVLLTYSYELISDHGWKRNIDAVIESTSRCPAPSTFLEELPRRVLVHVFEGAPEYQKGELNDHQSATRADEAMRSEFPEYMLTNPISSSL